MEKALSYIAAMQEAIRRVLPASTAPPLPLPVAGRRDPLKIISSLVAHLEAVLAGTSTGPLDVAAIVGADDAESPSEQEVAARRRGDATLERTAVVNWGGLEQHAATQRGASSSTSASEQESAARGRESTTSEQESGEVRMLLH